MDAQQAIALVAEWIRSHGLDYPTEGLAADRFEAGWTVYAPVDVDEDDPMAFLEMPVGRSVFLVGDSGRIKESSSSVPPQQAEDEFIAEELAAHEYEFAGPESAERDFVAEIQRVGEQLKAEGEISEVTIVDTPSEDEAIAARAAELLEPIVQQLAQLGPPGWRRFGVVLTCTVSAEITRLRFWTDQPTDLMPVPESIMVLVRRQREVAAGMSAGPWWRLLMTVTSAGRMTVDYDYGDKPFPEEDRLAPEHYRNDLASYPRAAVPDWLTDYLARPEPRREPDMVLDIRKGLTKRLYADPRVITYGRKSIPLAEVQWVKHWVVHTTTKSSFGLVKTHDTRWHFGVGTYPVTWSSMVEIIFSTYGKDTTPPEAWTFLVSLSQRHLEPRLVAELAAQVRNGDTVDVGGLRVSSDGVATRKGSLFWRAIGETRVANGHVWIYQAGVAKPMFSVSLMNTNAVLIPALFATLNS